MAAPNCPICGCTVFKDFNTRPNVMCRDCGSFERTRLAWLVVERLTVPELLKNAVHFAPEAGIARRLRERLGDGYRAYDFDPERYPIEGVPVARADLCEPLPFGERSQDLVLHNHVLEHVPCNVWHLMRRLQRTLRVGGIHVFSLPVVADHYGEDLEPRLRPSERVRLYGQDDHMRRFGRKDLREMLAEEFGRDIHFTQSVSIDEATLRDHSIPESVLTTISSHTVFVCTA